MQQTLPIIGLTGGIASGKSTVAHYLSQQGFHVIDSDKLGHRVLERGQTAYDQILQAFGRGILNPDATINRRALGNIVFNHPEELKKLNQISHPRIGEMIVEEVDTFATNSRAGLVVLEAAILLEAGHFPQCQQVWIVAVAPEIAVARLHERNQLSQAEAEARLRVQMSNAARQKYADVWIENNGSLKTLYQQVDAALAQNQL